ncbi:hypothetical protein C8R45DRAFT_1075647 [Mycena sanguinolenta]|nr:hypothetical protein C8R45DRAFT_1075647 [Mycena sanguinolenta]
MKLAKGSGSHTPSDADFDILAIFDQYLRLFQEPLDQSLTGWRLSREKQLPTDKETVFGTTRRLEIWHSITSISSTGFRGHRKADESSQTSAERTQMIGLKSGFWGRGFKVKTQLEAQLDRQLDLQLAELGTQVGALSVKHLGRRNLGSRDIITKSGSSSSEMKLFRMFTEALNILYHLCILIPRAYVFTEVGKHLRYLTKRLSLRSYIGWTGSSLIKNLMEKIQENWYVLMMTRALARRVG